MEAFEIFGQGRDLKSCGDLAGTGRLIVNLMRVRVCG